MKHCLSCGHDFSGADWGCPSCSYAPERVADTPLFAPGLAHENNGFDEESFARLYAVEENNFWFRSRNSLIAWAIGKYFPNARNLMEVGCGTGYVLHGIHEVHQGLSLTGTEIFSKGLEFARKRLPEGTALLQMDGRSIPFREEFDLIGAFDVIEHIDEDEEVLAQMYLALKPGGGLLLSVPQHPFLWSEDDEYACHKRRYTRNELQDKARRAGFELVRSTSFVTLLFPFMVASRMFRRARPQGKSYKTGDGLKLSGGLNRLFSWIMSLERWGLQAGINSPFGGSRMLIARKPF